MRNNQNSSNPFLQAVCSGDVEKVRAFVDGGAVDSRENPKNKEALCFAAQKTENNRVSIIRTLLEADIDVDAIYDAFGNTPLMLAIMEFPDDLESIKLLLDDGASLTIFNNNGKTAIDIARERHEICILDILQPKKTRSTFQSIIHMIVSRLLYILGKINVLNNGIMDRLFNLGQLVDAEIENVCDSALLISQLVHQADFIVSVEDLKNSMDQTVQDLELHKFFKNGNLLQTVAENAARLRENPTTDLGMPHNARRLVTLSMYQPVIFCDDSGSMSLDGRLERQADIVTRISRITTYLVPDDMGVAVHFINSTVQSPNTLREEGVAELLSELEARGPTELGYKLEEKILKPMLYDRIGRNEELERPILVSIITDGHPAGPRESRGNFVEVLKRCSTFLFENGYPQQAVIFQISQIGNDKEAAEFIDSLRFQDQIKDMIYCTSDQLDARYEEIKDNEKLLEEWLLTTLMGPIIQRGQQSRGT